MGFLYFTIMSRRLTDEIISNYISENYKDLIFIKKESCLRVIVENKYGKCRCRLNHLMNNNPPSIRSAINKTSYWINQAVEVHGDKYDYSKVEYINSKTKVCIICPIHGEFWQNAAAHLSGKGCNKCGNIFIGNKASHDIDIFIRESIKEHGNKYDYSKVDYVNSHTKVCIICPIHGEFWQRASNHMRGVGCKRCGYEIAKTKTSLTNSQFIAKSTLKHNGFYNYNKTAYISFYSKITVTCPIHGDFNQGAGAHLSGKGCRKCSIERNSFGMSRGDYIKMANGRSITLYKIHCWNDNENFYKIGITVSKTRYRFSGGIAMPYNYKVISEQVGDAKYIWNLEKKEHRRHKHLKYKPRLSFSGETECFLKLV